MFVAGTHVPVRDREMRSAIPNVLLRAVLVGAVAAALGFALAAVFDTGPALLYAVLMASSSAALALPIIDSLRLSRPQVLSVTAQIAVADATSIVLLPLVIDPQRAVGRLVFLRLLDLRGLARLGAAERREQFRHRRVGRGRQQEIDRRQRLIVHAPAAVDVEVGAHADDFRFRHVEAEAPRRMPLRSTQSSARMRSAALSAAMASGTRALEAGAPACCG